MTHKSVLGLLLGLAVTRVAASVSTPASAESKPTDAAQRRPNIVILFPDQLRWAEVGCYGHPVVRTPNIDRLGSQGARMTHAFTNFPICSPARSVLLSGRYARSNGVVENQDQEATPGRPTNKQTTIAEALNQVGYKSALVGKWHLAPTPAELGFTESVRCRMRHRYYKQTYYHNEGEPYVCENYSPHHETQAAIQFIRENREHPFFLYVAYGPPHMPVSELPERYRTMYDPARVILRDNVWADGKLAYDERWFKIYMWDFQYYQNADTFPGRLPEGMNLRDLTALYYGQITAVDDCVGQVLTAIKEAGLDEDTIVLFTSDHGDLLGSHQLFNKNRHYDEAIHIPMIIRYPRSVRPSVVSEQVVSLVDAMPTLLDLAGVSAPSSVQGTSVAPVLLGERNAVGKNAAFIETNTEDGIRTHDFLYSVERKKSNREHLFNCKADPFQMADLVSDPAHSGLLEELRHKVRDWQSRTTPDPKSPETNQAKSIQSIARPHPSRNPILTH